MTPLELCSKAFAEIGRGIQLSDFYDGSLESTIALNLYGQTRDDILSHKDWEFAGRTTILNLLKQGQVPPVDPWDETQPVPPWQYEYAYPDDMIQLRYLRQDPSQFAGWDPFEPLPARWRIANDLIDGTTPTKVILTNIPSALAIYTTRITSLDLWEPGAIQSLIEALAQKFTTRLTETANAPPAILEALLKGKLGEAGAEEQIADDRKG